MNDFPQIITERKAEHSPIIKRPIYTLDEFTHGDSVLFLRPNDVIEYKYEQRILKMVCNVKGYWNDIIQTHETQMNQFIEDESIEGQMNIQISFWTEDIIRIQFSEEDIDTLNTHKNKLENSMLLGEGNHQAYPAITMEKNNEVFLKSEQISIKITKYPFCIKAYNKHGKEFFSQRQFKVNTSDVFDMAIAKKGERTACFESLKLSNKEQLYGLGERFDYVNRRGRYTDFWNKDAIGSSNTRSYINVPFWFTTKGYGVFLNSTAYTKWELGTKELCTAGVGIDDHMMDYFVIHGPSPAEILYKYSTLTGFSPTPPVWSFGLWMSRNSYTSWDVVHKIADNVREKKIPCDVLHLDTAWFEEDWNCDLRFSKERFAEPKKNIAELSEKGYNISLWQYNFIPPRMDNVNFIEAKAKGYLVTDKQGDVFQFPKDTKGCWVDDAVIDFTNKEAVLWYKNQIEELIEMGAKAIKVDFGEGIPEDGFYANMDSHKVHNIYSLLYTKAIADATYNKSGEHIVWARSGTAGSQRYPVHWGGDSQCSWSGLAGTLKGALSIGLSAFPFFAHDIGGFIGRPDDELYIRWAQFGLFSSHSRCHGCGNYNSREPWSFGEKAEKIFRQYTELRYRLLPYIYNEAKKASHTAKPMVRALVIDYPEDRQVWHIEDQYTFGDSFLVAPILEPLCESETRDFYLPKGTWYDYWSGKCYKSNGQWYSMKVTIDCMPLFVKGGSVIPYTELRQYTDNKVGDIQYLEIYKGEEVDYAYNDDVTSFLVKGDINQVYITGLSDNKLIKHWLEGNINRVEL